MVNLKICHTWMIGVIAPLFLVHQITLVLADSGQALYSLADELTAWRFHLDAEKLSSFNMSSFPIKKAEADGFLTRLKAIDRHDLSSGDAFNYDILEDMLQTYVDGFRWWKYGYLNPVSFMNGEQLSWGQLNDWLEIREDFEKFISRIGLVKTLLAEYTELIREGIRLNRTYNAASLRKVPGQIDALLVDDPVKSHIYIYMDGMLDANTDITDSEKADLRRRTKEAISSGILQPFREFKQFILQEYIPNARRAAGVHEWPQGRDYYRACLLWHLSLPLTPDEIHDIGLEEVKRIAQQMTKVMRSQNFQGSISEYFEMLRSDPRFKLPTADAIIEEYTHMIHDRINSKLSSMFRSLPEHQVTVAAMSYDGSSAYYSSGVFYANVMRPNDTNTFDMMSLALHEANPGHHLQLTYIPDTPMPTFRLLRVPPRFRVPFHFPSNTGFIEGWGLYAEALGEEMGVYKDQYELMGRYSREMLRACRLVVDTGMHYKGWNREDAILYILNYTSYGRPSVENQVDRYITFPGQACAYKIGELKIWELRRKAEAELGDNFDIKEFHSTILNLYSVPLRFMEQAVGQMIGRVKSGINSAGHCRIRFSPVTVVFFVFVKMVVVTEWV